MIELLELAEKGARRMQTVMLIFGAVAAGCTSLAAVALPHPYDKWVLGVGSFCAGVFLFLLKSPLSGQQSK